MHPYGRTLGRPEPQQPIGSGASVQRVYYSDNDRVECWADNDPQDLTGCQRLATTDILLCDQHYEEIVPRRRLNGR